MSYVVAGQTPMPSSNFSDITNVYDEGTSTGCIKTGDWPLVLPASQWNRTFTIMGKYETQSPLPRFHVSVDSSNVPLPVFTNDLFNANRFFYIFL